MTYKQTLYWDDSYMVARKLHEIHGGKSLEQVSLDDIYNWTLELEDFDDEPGLANDSILNSIFNEWLELTFE